MIDTTPPGVPPGPPPPENGAGTIHLLDVDGTACDEGTDRLRPGVAEWARARRAEGGRVWLFTARSPGPWIHELARQGLEFEGYCGKPLANAYTIWDDRLQAAGTVPGVPRWRASP